LIKPFDYDHDWIRSIDPYLALSFFLFV
jgi:hypothetical protein